jgi:hypothetical protein
VLRHRELLGSLAYRNRMFGRHYHPTNLSEDRGSPPPPYPEPVLSTGLLSFPHFKGGFDGQKVFMFVVPRMSLDRCPGPGETTTACWAKFSCCYACCFGLGDDRPPLPAALVGRGRLLHRPRRQRSAPRPARMGLRQPFCSVPDPPTMAREAEEEWNKARPRRGLFDMDQKALVLRSPAAR